MLSPKGLFLETGSHVAEAGLEFAIAKNDCELLVLLPPLLEC